MQAAGTAQCDAFACINPSSGAYAQDVFPSGKRRETHCVSYSSPLREEGTRKLPHPNDAGHPPNTYNNMKKFYLNLILLCVALLLCLNSCGGRARLYDVVLSATAAVIHIKKK